MLAALLAITMCSVWVAYVVIAVLGIASLDPARFALFVVLTPFVLIFERFGFKGMDHLTSQG